MAQKQVCAVCGKDWKYGKCGNPDCQSTQIEWKEYDPEDPQKRIEKGNEGSIIRM